MKEISQQVTNLILDIPVFCHSFLSDSGEKFAFGHHYLRPHETFHEPNRKFFDNEVFRIPLYEIVPLEAIVTNCVVMDLPTYCKGRPKDVNEKDIYICEYRIDKNARMFNKIGKPKYPVNTKSYCFERFPVKMYPKRTYSVCVTDLFL